MSRSKGSQDCISVLRIYFLEESRGFSLIFGLTVDCRGSQECPSPSVLLVAMMGTLRNYMDVILPLG